MNPLVVLLAIVVGLIVAYRQQIRDLFSSSPSTAEPVETGRPQQVILPAAAVDITTRNDDPVINPGFKPDETEQVMDFARVALTFLNSHLEEEPLLREAVKYVICQSLLDLQVCSVRGNVLGWEMARRNLHMLGILFEKHVDHMRGLLEMVRPLANNFLTLEDEELKAPHSLRTLLEDSQRIMQDRGYTPPKGFGTHVNNAGQGYVLIAKC